MGPHAVPVRRRPGGGGVPGPPRAGPGRPSRDTRRVRLDGPRPDDPPRPIRLPEGCDRYVLAVGTVEPRKDYPLLVSAFDERGGAHPDVALVVVGARRLGRGALHGRRGGISLARTGSCVAGYLDDRGLDATLRHAAVLAYPSRYEGFGFPPLQAMAAGVPVVATAAGAVPEVVGDGALLVDAGDGDGLAGALSRVLDGGAEVEALVGPGSPTERRCSPGRPAPTGLAGLYRDACSDRGSGTAGGSRAMSRSAPVDDGRAAAATGLGRDRHLHPGTPPGPRRPGGR